MQNNSQLVSICLPTFNNGKYIEETIKSLINQTYKNIEIIISDNASVDETKKIVTKYKDIDNRIHYYRNSNNIGYCNNIAKAVSYAKSDIIAIYHSDDIYHKTIIEKELNLLIYDSRVCGVFTTLFSFNDINVNELRHYDIYETLKKYDVFDKKRNIFKWNLENFVPIMAKYGNIFVCPTFMCRKETYLSLGGFSDDYPSNEDFDLWLKFLNSGCTLEMINEPLLYYRQSVNSGSSFYDKSTDLPMMYQFLIDYKKKNANLFYDDQVTEDLNKLISRGFCYAARKSIKNGKYIKALEQIEKSKDYYKFSVNKKIGYFQITLLIVNKIRRIFKNI